jgi:hypothetical protein
LKGQTPALCGTVIPETKAVAIFALELFTSGRSWICFEGKDSIAHTPMDFVGQAVHLLLG